jgi:hypothetical protein
LQSAQISEIYQSLSYRFVFRSNAGGLALRASALIGEFAEPLGDAAEGGAGLVSYSLLEDPADPARRYRLERDGDQVGATADAGTAINQLMWWISTDTVDLADGYLLIHAGAVVGPNGDAVLILGESGAGKTTAAAALVQVGYGYLSDEAGAISLSTGLAHPWPRPLGFTASARSLPRFASLFDGDWDGADELHVSVARIRPDAVAAPARVRHVIDYRYCAGAETSVEPLSRATALSRMGSAAPRLRREGDVGLEVLAELMRGASGYEMVSGDLERGVDVIRGLVER